MHTVPNTLTNERIAVFIDYEQRANPNAGTGQ